MSALIDRMREFATLAKGDNKRKAKETLSALLTKWRASNKETVAIEQDIRAFCKENDLKIPSALK